MSETVKTLAEKYYPVLWPLCRLKALVAAGKLMADEYKAITGETYTEA
jgi:hypothetical protein